MFVRVKFKRRGIEQARRYGTFSLQYSNEGQPQAGVEGIFGLAEVESVRERLRRGPMAGGETLGAGKPHGN